MLPSQVSFGAHSPWIALKCSHVCVRPLDSEFGELTRVAWLDIRMPDGMEWTAIPEAVLNDAAQLVKANSVSSPELRVSHKR